MISKREKHTINGRLQGVWYETEGGHKLYLAHRTQNDTYRPKDRNLIAWGIDTSTLDRAKRRGVHAIGVMRKEGRHRLIWLAHINDFYNPDISFEFFFKSRQRGIPLNKFRIDPMKSEKAIEIAVRLR